MLVFKETSCAPILASKLLFCQDFR